MSMGVGRQALRKCRCATQLMASMEGWLQEGVQSCSELPYQDSRKTDVFARGGRRESRPMN